MVKLTKFMHVLIMMVIALLSFNFKNKMLLFKLNRILKIILLKVKSLWSILKIKRNLMS